MLLYDHCHETELYQMLLYDHCHETELCQMLLYDHCHETELCQMLLYDHCHETEICHQRGHAKSGLNNTWHFFLRSSRYYVSHLTGFFSLYISVHVHPGCLYGPHVYVENTTFFLGP